MATTTRIAVQRPAIKRQLDQPQHPLENTALPDETERLVRLRHLSHEALALVSRLSPRPQERALRAHIVSRIEELVNTAFSSTPSVEPTVDIVGSLSTGIYLPGGDVDIVIHVSDMDPADVLTTLYTVLKADAESNPESLADLLSIKPIMTARIPVLKFRTKLGQVAVDVTANTRSGSVSTQLVKQWMDIYPTTLKPLVILIKRWLAERKFDEVYTGGLGGYAVANMGLALILVSRSARRVQQLRAGSGAGSIVGGGRSDVGAFGGQDDAQDPELGRLIVEFFETYGMTLDYARKGVSVRIGRFVDRPPGANRLRYAPVGASSTLDFGMSLYVEDPADPSNDVCRASYRVAEIREAMADSFVRLEDALDGRIGAGKGMLDGIVGLIDEEEKYRDLVCGEWDQFVERMARRQAQHGQLNAPSSCGEQEAEGGPRSVPAVVIDRADDPVSDVQTDSEVIQITTEVGTSLCDAAIDDEPRASCGKRVREGSSPSHDGDPEQRLKPPNEDDPDHHSDRSHEDRGRHRRKKERRRSKSGHKEGRKSKSKQKKSRGREKDRERERDLEGNWRHRETNDTTGHTSHGEHAGKDGPSGPESDRRRRRRDERGSDKDQREKERRTRSSGEKRDRHAHRSRRSRSRSKDEALPSK